MLAIHGAKIFDGDQLVAGSVLTINGARIEGIQNGPAPVDFEVHELSECTLLPGLIDAHTHLCFDATLDPVRGVLNRTESEVLASMTVSARRALSAGITSVRDLGDRGFLSLELARLTGRQSDAGPDIVASGPPITSVGGHCHFLGGAAQGTSALAGVVRAWAARGVHLIKVMVTGGTMTPGSDPVDTQFSQDELDTIVRTGHEAGLAVTAHAHGATGIAMAVRAGVDGLEHAKFWTASGINPSLPVIDAIASRGIWLCPTLGALPAAAPPPPAVARRAAKAAELVGELHRRGVRLVAGSDGGISPAKPHDVLPLAVAEMAACGVSTVDSLRAATSVAARACGLERKGVLRAGMDADIVAVVGDPVTDLAALRAVRAVYRAGRLVWRAGQADVA